MTARTTERTGARSTRERAAANTAGEKNEPGTSAPDHSPPTSEHRTTPGSEPKERRTGSHLALGAEGEAHAARYLEARGYRILERNVRAGGVEVDLIARRRGMVVFVEVKTRRGTRQGPPELAVDAAKQARLVRAASAWLRGSHERFTRARFDVIACTRPTSRTRGGPQEPAEATWHIEHLPGAFDAGG